MLGCGCGVMRWMFITVSSPKGENDIIWICQDMNYGGSVYNYYSSRIDMEPGDMVVWVHLSLFALGLFIV